MISPPARYRVLWPFASFLGRVLVGGTWFPASTVENTRHMRRFGSARQGEETPAHPRLPTPRERRSPHPKPKPVAIESEPYAGQARKVHSRSRTVARTEKQDRAHPSLQSTSSSRVHPALLPGMCWCLLQSSCVQLYGTGSVCQSQSQHAADQARLPAVAWKQWLCRIISTGRRMGASQRPCRM